MTHTLARMPSGRSGLALVRDNDDIKIFDPHTGEMRDPGKRVDTIATLSLGYKGEKGIPVITREVDERWLHPHDADDAPELIDALKRGQYRRLTISLPSDDWGDFCQQHPAAYTASKLKIYGDDTTLFYIGRQKVIDPHTGEQAVNAKDEPIWEVVHVPILKAKQPELYTRMLKETKPQISIYFYLAEWAQTPDGWLPQVVMDGNVGMYRLRTTSLHTIENLASTVKQIRALTKCGGAMCGDVQCRGHIKGVPLTLSVGFPEVADPGGSKRKVPVCTFRLQPPYKVTPVMFAPMLEAAVNQGQMLALQAPAVETMEDEERSAPVDPGVIATDEREIDLIARGGRCPVGRYTRIFFSLVKDTEFGSDTARAQLVADYTDNRTPSLSELLHWSTDEEAQAFIAYVDEQLNGPDDPEPERPEIRNDEYERLYSAAYQEPAHPLTTPPPSIRQRQQTQPDGSVVDTLSGEVLQEAPTASAPISDPIDAESRQVQDAEIAQADARLQVVAADLDELIGQAEDAPPEPPEDDERLIAAATEHEDVPAQALGQADGSDSSSTNEEQEGEPLDPKQFDYGLCLEIYQNHPELTLDKPLPRLKPDAYAKWHADYVAKLEAAGALPF